jgi:hypothetical protein
MSRRSAPPTPVPGSTGRCDWSSGCHGTPASETRATPLHILILPSRGIRPRSARTLDEVGDQPTRGRRPSTRAEPQPRQPSVPTRGSSGRSASPRDRRGGTTCRAAPTGAVCTEVVPIHVLILTCRDSMATLHRPGSFRCRDRGAQPGCADPGRHHRRLEPIGNREPGLPSMSLFGANFRRSVPLSAQPLALRSRRMRRLGPVGPAGQVASRASRTPANIHRACGRKKLR